MLYYLFDPNHQALIEDFHTEDSSNLRKRLGQFAFGVGALLFGLYMIVSFLNPLQVLLNGAPTTGETLNFYKQTKGGPHITYRYTVDGIVYTGDSGVSQELYNLAPNNTNLPVLYARHNPSISVLEAVSIPTLLGTGLFALVAIGAFISTLFTFITRFTRPQLDRHQVLPGALLNLTTSPLQNGNTLWRIQYEFLSPRSKRIVGNFTCPATAHAPTPGVTLAIMYQNESMHHPL